MRWIQKIWGSFAHLLVEFDGGGGEDEAEEFGVKERFGVGGEGRDYGGDRGGDGGYSSHR